MLMNSNSRMSNLRAVFTNSGNSATHGMHQVAQTLNTRTFFVPFLRSAATPGASIVATSTGVLSHFSAWAVMPPFLLIHLVEQPCGLVTSPGAAFPAISVSPVLLVSADFTVAASFRCESLIWLL